MKLHKPKTIQEAIEDLAVFLECDLYKQLRPKEIVNGKVFYREDIIDSEEEFVEYIREHFKILQKQVRELEEKGE